MKALVEVEAEIEEVSEETMEAEEVKQDRKES